MISMRKGEKRNWKSEPRSPGLKAQPDMQGYRKLKEIVQAMDSMISRNDLADFFKNPENAQELNGLVEDIRHALMDYRVCTLK